MIDWLKHINKDHPVFWKNYISKFDKKSNRFVVLCTEKTGINPKKDVITSIGSFSVMNNNILIGDSFETVLFQNKFFHDNGFTNEFVVESKMKKTVESEAIQAFIEYIGNSILVGHHIDFEVDMINAALEKLDCGRLKNEALDINIMYRKLKDISNKQFSLDELCEIYKIPNEDHDSSSEDAYKIALLFLKLKSRLGLN